MLVKRTDNHGVELLHLGPFEWFPDPLDPVFRWGNLVNYLGARGQLVHSTANLPTFGRVLGTYHFDGVELMIFQGDGDANKYYFREVYGGRSYDGPDGQHRSYVERSFEAWFQLAIDGFISEEQRLEIKSEMSQIEENVAHVQAALRHIEAISALRQEASFLATAEFTAVIEELRAPGLTKTVIRMHAARISKLRLKILGFEAMSEEDLFSLVRDARLVELMKEVDEALAVHLAQPSEFPVIRIITAGHENDPEPTQEALDARVGALYRVIRLLEACNTPEELVEL